MLICPYKSRPNPKGGRLYFKETFLIAHVIGLIVTTILLLGPHDNTSCPLLLPGSALAQGKLCGFQINIKIDLDSGSVNNGVDSEDPHNIPMIMQKSVVMGESNSWRKNYHGYEFFFPATVPLLSMGSVWYYSSALVKWMTQGAIPKSSFAGVVMGKGDHFFSF